jgi:hypothetical protein
MVAVRCDDDAEPLQISAKGGDLRIPDHARAPLSAA